MIDITELASLPTVNKALYITDEWHYDAPLEEVSKDISSRPTSEQQALWAALQQALPQARAQIAPRRKVNAARREASAQEKRQYAQQFKKAKDDEWKSWKDENDVLELVDMRKVACPNYVTGRWVLTIKRDKAGKFLKVKARWVLRGFQDQQVWNLQTDSPTATRPGFRLQCQEAANKLWDIIHIDLRTAFLQGEEFDSSRQVVCQLPPEAGYPPYHGRET